MGTSLTASSPGWPDKMQTWMKTEALSPSDVSVWNRGVPASAVWHRDWDKQIVESYSGITHALPIIKASLPRPDVVFIEYSINDAYLPYQLTVEDSKYYLNLIIDDYLEFNPDMEIVPANHEQRSRASRHQSAEPCSLLSGLS